DVRFHATLLMNAFRNSGFPNNSDVPTFVQPRVAPPGGNLSNLGFAIRQTRLRVSLDQDSVLGGRLAAEIDADFFGGQQPSTGGRTHPLLRLRRAVAEVRWRGGAILIGQEAPPVFELNPLSVASLGFPEFAASGNLWLWLPQVRALAWLNPGSAVRLGVEAAALAPNAGTAQPAFLT